MNGADVDMMLPEQAKRKQILYNAVGPSPKGQKTLTATSSAILGEPRSLNFLGGMKRGCDGMRVFRFAARKSWRYLAPSLRLYAT